MKRFFFIVIMFLSLIFCTTAVNSQEMSESNEILTSAGAEAATPQAEVTPENPAETLPEKPAIPAEEKPKEEEKAIVLLDDALPEGSTSRGIWDWDSSLKFSGERSHTEPSMKGLTEHSYTLLKPIGIPKNHVIEQYVYLDPNNMPKGILIKFRFELNGKEGEIGVYREGEEEVFIFNNDEPMLYEGTLPYAGKWEKLEIPADDLNLGGTELIGISFVTYGGKAYWDLTQITPIKQGQEAHTEFTP